MRNNLRMPGRVEFFDDRTLLFHCYSQHIGGPKTSRRSDLVLVFDFKSVYTKAMASFGSIYSEIERGYEFTLDMRYFSDTSLVNQSSDFFKHHTTNVHNPEETFLQQVPVKEKVLKTTEVKRLSNGWKLVFQWALSFEKLLKLLWKYLRKKKKENFKDNDLTFFSEKMFKITIKNKIEAVLWKKN